MESGTPLQLLALESNYRGRARSNQLGYFCLEFKNRSTGTWTKPIKNNFTEILENPDLEGRLNKRQNELAVLDKLLVGSTRPRLIGAAFPALRTFVSSWTNQLRKKSLGSVQWWLELMLIHKSSSFTWQESFRACVENLQSFTFWNTCYGRIR